MTIAITDDVTLSFVLIAIGFLLLFYKATESKYLGYFKDFSVLMFTIYIMAAAFYTLSLTDGYQDVTFNSVNVISYITTNDLFSSNYIGANIIYAATYLNLPSVAGSACSYCVANAFVGFNSLSYLNINSITANEFIGLHALSPILYTNGNTISCPTCSTGGSGLPSTVTANVFVGFDANSYLAINSITANSASIPTMYGNTFGAVDSETSQVDTPTVVANTFTTTNGVFTHVGFIEWNAPTVSQLQYVSGQTYTNTNATFWIVHAETVSPGATTPKISVYIGGILIYDAQAYVAGTNSLQTFIVPYGMTFNVVWTRYEFNSILVR